MRRIAFVVIAAVFGILLTANSAFADSPHFLFATNSISANTGALTTSFKDAGLGTGATSIQITLTVDTATAVYQCFNNGGKHPQAGNKETVSAEVGSTGQFDVRHGSTSGSISVGVPGPGDFSCPSGQTLHLISVEYTNVTLTDTSVTPNDVASIPGTFSSGTLFP
jgi:hypothetical protein